MGGIILVFIFLSNCIGVIYINGGNGFEQLRLLLLYNLVYVE